MVQSSTGKYFVQALQCKVDLGGAFVVQSTIVVLGGTLMYFVQGLYYYKVVLGTTFCNACSTK